MSNTRHRISATADDNKVVLRLSTALGDSLITNEHVLTLTNVDAERLLLELWAVLNPPTESTFCP